jgi:hypothetical protein
MEGWIAVKDGSMEGWIERELTGPREREADGEAKGHKRRCHWERKCRATLANTWERETRAQQPKEQEKTFRAADHGREKHHVCTGPRYRVEWR